MFLPQQPKSIIIVGSGAIGVEFGYFYNSIGTKVTIVEFLPRIAVGFDADVSTALQKLLGADGLKFHVETKVTEVKVEGGKAFVRATAKGGSGALIAVVIVAVLTDFRSSRVRSMVVGGLRV